MPWANERVGTGNYSGVLFQASKTGWTTVSQYGVNTVDFGPITSNPYFLMPETVPSRYWNVSVSKVVLTPTGRTFAWHPSEPRLMELKADGTVVDLAGSRFPGTADGTGDAARFANNYAYGRFFYSPDLNKLVASDYEAERHISLSGEITTATQPSFPRGGGEPLDFALPFQTWQRSGTGQINIRTFAPDGSSSSVLIGGADAGDQEGDFATARLFNPGPVAKGPDGMLYIWDAGNHKLRKADPVARTVRTILGGSAGHIDGSFAVARLEGVERMTVGPDGNLYSVGETPHQRLRKVDLARERVSTLVIPGADAFRPGREIGVYPILSPLQLDAQGRIYCLRDDVMAAIAPAEVQFPLQ